MRQYLAKRFLSELSDVSSMLNSIAEERKKSTDGEPAEQRCLLGRDKTRRAHLLCQFADGTQLELLVRNQKNVPIKIYMYIDRQICFKGYDRA